jgi:hypothetical protein
MSEGRREFRLLALLVLGAAACSSDNARSYMSDRTRQDGPMIAAPILRDARVDSAAYAACVYGDSLLRRSPQAAVTWMPPVPFDSVWHSPTPRWACGVVAAGRMQTSALSVNSLLHAFAARGWSSRTLISADGPDGTVQGMHRAGVTCVFEGRWDGGDDSDSTYVPSDTIEVRVACTRTAATDTSWQTPPR